MRSDDTIPTRHSLLKRLQDWDDQVSWQEFYDSYAKLIYSVARKAGLDDAAAQEVVQETLISVAKKFKEGFSYDPEVHSFKGWLLQLTRWRILNQVKKGYRDRKRIKPPGRDSTRTATVERIPDPASLNLDAVWEREWAKNAYDTAMIRVRKKARPEHVQMFDLVVNQQWPVKQVAQGYGISPARVYLVKHRISRLLQKELEVLTRQGR